jgi:phosphoglycolate phosphatase
MDGPGRIDAVAFDLDGTLVDSAPDISRALNSSFVKAGLKPFDLATIRCWIGDGPDALIVRALVGQGIDPADGALRARLRRAFDVATLAAPLSCGSVYAGIATLLAGLRRELPLVVVTNKPTALARAVLGAAGLLPSFVGVQGADSPERRKPAPAMLLEAAARLEVPPSRLLMVGDAVTDLLAAQAAHCPAALVHWGYGGSELPAGMDPWHVDTPLHLLAGLIGSRETSQPPLRRAPCRPAEKSPSPSS